MCDIIKSRNTQIRRVFLSFVLENLTFHKTIRKKVLRYSYQEKDHKNTNLQIKKDKTDNHFSKLFLFTFQAVRICFKKSELIFKHYYTIIRPKHIGH